MSLPFLPLYCPCLSYDCNIPVYSDNVPAFPTTSLFLSILRLQCPCLSCFVPVYPIIYYPVYLIIYYPKNFASRETFSSGNLAPPPRKILCSPLSNGQSIISCHYCPCLYPTTTFPVYILLLLSLSISCQCPCLYPIVVPFSLLSLSLSLSCHCHCLYPAIVPVTVPL